MYKKTKHYLEEKKLWEIFIYIFFGGLATVVNFIAYFITRDLLQLGLVSSNTISWIASVLFAFVTNKLWVFHSQSPSIKHLLIEFSKFVFYRLVSYGMDMGTMVLLVDFATMNEYLAKIITQIIVIIANYVFSKLFIFNKGTEIIEDPHDK